MDILEVLTVALLRGGMYSLMAIGLTMIFGVMNVPDFAYGEYYMFGAYCGYVCVGMLNLNPIYGLIVTCIAGFLFGVVLDRGILHYMRVRSGGDWLHNAFVVTLGISISLQNLAKLVFGAKYGGVIHYWGGVLKVGSFIQVGYDRIVSFFIALSAIFIFFIFLKFSQLGRAIRAVSENEMGGRLVGIEFEKIYTIVYGLGCMLAALGGFSFLPVVSVYPTVGLEPLSKAWLVVILVGMGKIWQTMIGGGLLALIETISYYYIGRGWQDAISFSLVIIVFLFKPVGLFGIKEVKAEWEK